MKRKRHLAIAAPDQSPLRWPERADNLIVITPDERINVRGKAEIIVSPDSNYSAWRQNAARLGIKGVQVEPMQCLCHRDCRDGTRRQTGRLRGRDAIFHPLVRLSIRDLICARIEWPGTGTAAA